MCENGGFLFSGSHICMYVCESIMYTATKWETYPDDNKKWNPSRIQSIYCNYNYTVCTMVWLS